jgi:hypothetical protein
MTDEVASATPQLAPMSQEIVERRHQLRDPGCHREREFPTRLIQAIQARIQGALLPLTHESGQARVPGWLQMALRLPGVSGLPPYVMEIGFRPAKLRPELIAEEPVSGATGPS